MVDFGLGLGFGCCGLWDLACALAARAAATAAAVADADCGMTGGANATAAVTPATVSGGGWVYGTYAPP